LDGKTAARNRKLWRRLEEGEDTARRWAEAKLKMKTKKERKKFKTYYIQKL
jgi:hypothetical protein